MINIWFSITNLILVAMVLHDQHYVADTSIRKIKILLKLTYCGLISI